MADDLEEKSESLVLSPHQGMMRAQLTRCVTGHAARRLATLATEPNMTLRVTGVTPRLIIKTNMETYVANLDASGGGKEVDVAAWSTVHEGGDLSIQASVADADGVTRIDVPAGFSVHVEMASACDVSVDGWLEGTVDVSVPSGGVYVNTVRGLLTSISTGEGDVKVDHVEGNLHVNNGAAGDVTLGKIMGEDLRVLTSGGLKARALYSKRLDVQAAAGVRASVLSAEEGRLCVGGDSVLDSTEGVLQLVHAGAGSVTVQAGETLRSLGIGRADDDLSSSEAEITLHLPSGMGARALIKARQLTLDERLEARAVTVAGEEAGVAAAASTAGADGTQDSMGAFVRPPAPLSTSGTKTFAGYESGSSTAATPWWSSEARTGWAMSADSAQRAGCEAYVLGGAAEAGEACELSVVAGDAHVTLGVQSWFEQRLKLKTERKAQPYR